MSLLPPRWPPWPGATMGFMRTSIGAVSSRYALHRLSSALSSTSLSPTKIPLNFGTLRKEMIMSRLTMTQSSPRSPIVRLRAFGSMPMLRDQTTTTPQTSQETIHEGAIWLDNVFPVKAHRFDPRHFFAKRYAADFKNTAKKTIIPPPEAFKGEFIYGGSTPSIKEGGMLLQFTYKGASVEEAYDSIRAHIQNGGVRSFFNFQQINAYPIRGVPFVEDMTSSIPTSRLKVEFQGPELNIEQLYKEFRQYGKIYDISVLPGPQKDTRVAHVQYMRVRSATSARNCIHGEKIGTTRLNVSYEPPLTRNLIFNFMRDHPRISLPLLFALLTLLSFLVFDPLRIFFVSSEIGHRFDLMRYRSLIGDYLSSVTSFITDIFVGDSSNFRRGRSDKGEVVTELASQEKKLITFMKETPETVMVVTGPKGSGKSELVAKAAANEPYKLVINCEELVGLPDHALLSQFARQVGYFPLFSWMVNAGAFIDAIVTATTGTKAGLSSTNEQQVQKILEIVTLAINRIATTQREAQQKAIALQKSISEASADDPSKLAKIPEIPDIQYPVIIIEGFLSKENSKQHFMYDLLAEWAALLAEYHIAQVVFVSNNPGAVKFIGKSITNRSIETVNLTDASPEASMAYVRRRLALVSTPPELEQCIEALGGRLTDIELLIQKIHAGQKDKSFTMPQIITRAFNDIVVRSVTEIRKLGLGEESSSVTSKKEGEFKKEWTTPQFWKIVKLLAKKEEVSFDELRFHPIFKGDETAIQSIERAGLITVGLKNGRPFIVRAGRPIYRTAFKSLIEDTKYAALMDIRLLKALMADEDVKIAKYETEMGKLVESFSFMADRSGFFTSRKNDLERRFDFLAGMLGESQKKIADYDAEERRLKALLKLQE
ncbi:mitochondrial escape protein 2 [Chytridiales sp. JEL 0842]|nr:mitochondrial escape protein 2 [Chytridiales sp. JEL 0842]